MTFRVRATNSAIGTRAPADAQADAPAATHGRFLLLTAVCAVGVLIIAIAFAGARENRGWADAGLWAGMLIIVLPVSLRLLGERASRIERLGLVMLLGLALYAVPVLLSPTQFVLHDELGAYRTVADILRSGNLYTPVNPVVPAYSAYPGLGSATAALSRMSGLGIVPCGLVLVGAAKVLTMGGLFLFIERCSRSARVAGVALALYAANPNFVYFDGQFAYESLALGIAALSLWMMVRAADEGAGRWGDVLLAALLDAALVLTHHLTSYAVAIVYTAWFLVLVARGRNPSAVSRLGVLAGFSVLITGVYMASHLQATESDIGSSIVGSLRGLYDVIIGASHGKAPFTAAAGYSNPPLEQVIGLLSVVLLILAWPVGLFVAWRSRWSGPAKAILGLVALAYPASLALRLTGAGSETSNRTSEFVFVGLAATVALAFVVLLGPTLDLGGLRSRALRVWAVVYIGVVFAGGITVGMPPTDLLPGSYLVGADNRSIDTEGEAAARWAARWLPAGDRFLSDVADNELLSAYTQLRPQGGLVGRIAIGQLFVSPTYGPEERHIIAFDKLRYLIVDRRDSTALPVSGSYFSESDPKKYSSPIPLTALEKFNNVACIDRIFSSGNVIMYFTGRVVAGCR